MKGIWLFPFFNIMICVIGVLLLIGATILGFSLDASGIVSTNAILSSISEPNAPSPLYVEWDGEFATVHPSMRSTYLDVPDFELGDGATPRVVEAMKESARDSHLEATLECVLRSAGRRHIVVLVRPTGFSNFLFMREYLLEAGVLLGYEPVGQYWKFDPSGDPCL